ncbi:hypothetical protein, partial [Nocardia gipuzkoensis]
MIGGAVAVGESHEEAASRELTEQLRVRGRPRSGMIGSPQGWGQGETFVRSPTARNSRPRSAARGPQGLIWPPLRGPRLRELRQTDPQEVTMPK